MADVRTTRYRDDRAVYAGIVGENVEIASANPRNQYDVIAGDVGATVAIDGKLFVPPGDGPRPAVVMVPGSLGVGPNHEAHAETLVGEGYAVLVVDPFGPRAVSSTVANQTQYSFAASGYDVLAAYRMLAQRPEIDARRIAAQGHSRGGSAVLTAASRRFADAVVGPGAGLAAVYAVYPWCGQQFLDPAVGSTRVRAIIGDRDEWCSVQQVQAQVQAIRLAGGDASLRIVGGAAHSFDREEPLTLIEEASVAPTAPTVMLSDDGSMVDPWTGEADPGSVDADMFVAAVDGGFGVRGARIGGADGQPELFREDMLTFHAAL